MGTINYLQAIKPDTAYIKKFIESSLLSDWVIRIEYHEVGSESASWQLWDNTFFALHSADPVLASLMNCYTRNSNCVIRINAEKLRPQSHLLYTVYNPSYVVAETESKPLETRTLLPLEQEVTPTQQVDITSRLT